MSCKISFKSKMGSPKKKKLNKFSFSKNLMRKRKNKLKQEQRILTNLSIKSKKRGNRSLAKKKIKIKNN